MPKGKGDSSTQTVKLPPEIEALATRNLQGAEKAGQIGYVPYQGPTMAALNPAAIANMRNNQQMAGAFGLQTADPTAALPQAQTYAGGMQGYSPFDLYTQALSKIAPGQAAAIKSFSINPQTGAASTAVAQPKRGSGNGGSSRYQEGGTYIVGGQQYRARGGRLYKVTGSRKT
jgi:hypothetical protein